MPPVGGERYEDADDDDTERRGLLRPRVRARRLRDRLRRGHDPSGQPPCRDARAHGPREPRPPGRVRRRPGHRRRRRSADPAAAPVLRGGCRFRPARAWALRHGYGLPPERSGRGRTRQRPGRRDRRRGGARGHRLARGAGRPGGGRRGSQGRRAELLAGLPRVPCSRRRRRRDPRAPVLRRAQAGRARDLGGLLPLVVDPDVRLQGDARAATAARLLPRSQRRTPREPDRARPLEVLDQHLPVVAAGSSLPVRRSQRRDQHACRQPELDDGPGGPAGDRPHRGRSLTDLSGRHAGRERFGHLRRGPGAAPPRRSTASPCGAR